MARFDLTDEERRQMAEAQLARCRNPDLADVVERNIHTIIELRRQRERSRGLHDRIADAITAFSGSMAFVYIHAAWFGLWVLLNSPWFGPWRFDPFPYGLLTMIVSLEAIFLSTFVLISQNRLSEVADQRADLDLQINLLAEHEITRVLKLVDAIADHLGLEASRDPEVDELKHDVAPDIVLREMEERKHEHDRHHDKPQG
jgi:uncharacterized membrane protein